MKRVLGEPEGAPTKGKSAGTDVYKYPGKGDLQGTVEVTARHSDGVITSIHENLPVALPRTPAYKRFGTDFRTVMYSRADCAKKDGFAPLYRDRNGQVEMIEYPNKGMALALDQYGYDVASVHYLSLAPGLATAPACVAREAKSKKKSKAPSRTSQQSRSAEPENSPAAKSPISMK